MPRPRSVRFEPYSEFTRPVWLDIMQKMMRPFPTNGQNGYAASGAPDVPTNSILLTSETTVGGLVFNVTTDKGASFFEKMPVLIGDNAQDWQVNTVNSIAGDAVTCNIPAVKAWPAGTYFVPLWGNEYHLSTWGQTWFAALLANARMGEVDMCGRNILGSVGAITTFGTESGTGILNMPNGWASVNSAHLTPSSALVLTDWGITSVTPVCRMGNGKGIQITTSATDTGGTGIQLATPVSVRPGEEYSLSAICKSEISSLFTLQAYDATNGAVIAETGTDPDTAINSYQGATIAAVRFALNFAIPEGCTQLQVRFVTTTHAAGSYMGAIDDVILVPARVAVEFDQYVIPDVRPCPIVLFGDSWGAGVLSSYFSTLMQARYPGITVINLCHAGYNLGDLNGDLNEVFDSEVRPLQPAIVVHYSGMQNDITDAGTQATKEGWIDRYIENARSIGARPVFFGASPHVDNFSDACDLNDYMRARCALHGR